jgi:prolyl oligopeptidase
MPSPADVAALSVTGPDRPRADRPYARREDVTEQLHGITVADPYRWLEDPDSAATQEWCADQDAVWQAIRAQLPDAPWWHDQVRNYLDVDYVSTPVCRGQMRFVMRHERGGARPELCVSGPDGVSRSLLARLPATLAEAADLRLWQPSLDGSLLALSFSIRGSIDASLYVMDVATGDMIEGPIPGCRNTSVAWLPGSQSLYYVRSTGTGSPPSRGIYWHQVGAGTKADELVFDHSEPAGLFYSVSARRDGRWLVVSGSGGSPAAGNDLWLADLSTDPLDPPCQLRFRCVQPRQGHCSGITFGPDGLLYILTNRDAPFWRIMVADPEAPDYDDWRELVAAEPDAIITDFAILGGADGGPGQILVSRARDAISEVGVHDLRTGRQLREVPLPGAGTTGPLVTREGQSGRAWFSFTATTSSPRVMEYQAETGMAQELTPVSQECPFEAQTSRVWCTSKDGTRIQLIIIRPNDSDGPIPTIISAYGGFGVPYQPTYSSAAMAWVHAGGSFVIANIRGGGERGEAWHAAGRGHLKQNSIDDILSCARFLIAEGYSSSHQLAVWGGSNGGLLAAATITQEPGHFAAAVCASPLCDMVRYESSGLGKAWSSEYGTAGSADDFEHLLAYSPYHNLQPGRGYPATLLTMSQDDDRVDPLHSCKMCAALQHAADPHTTIALRREHKVGHSGRAIGAMVALSGDSLAFLALHCGLPALPDTSHHTH